MAAAGVQLLTEALLTEVDCIDIYWWAWLKMAAAMCGHSRYLCVFAQQHLDFRLQELLSLTKLFNGSLNYDHVSPESPFLIINDSNEKLMREISSRSSLIRSIYELWAVDRNYEGLKTSLENMPQHLMKVYHDNNYTFSIRVKAYNKTLSFTYQRDKIETLNYLPLNGSVNLSSPTHEFHLLEDYGDDHNSTPEEPYRVFFGRLIATGQRQLMEQYSLKERYFIGNTSMDPLLSFVMSNMAQVKQGDLVLDPFAGTGGILVSCAHWGAHVVGGDIDWPLLHARGKTSRANAASRYRAQDESLRTNLRKYGLEDRYVDMLVCDAARPVWRQCELFDAIITDPPYGIREKSRKVGSTDTDGQTRERSPPATESMPHFPSSSMYKLSNLFVDLVQFAAKALVIGGHLVYWMPVIMDEHKDEHIPTHPSLAIMANSEQPLVRSAGRRLITMKKVKNTLMVITEPEILLLKKRGVLRYFPLLQNNSSYLKLLRNIYPTKVPAAIMISSEKNTFIYRHKT